jgi:LmbE family N-acetylglucosaminyl deacetylase
MPSPLRLLCVFAHPDDESLGAGPTLAHYAAQGVETFLLTATRGERGWFGVPPTNPGLAEMGRLREAELCAAAQQLGLREVTFLDYVDGELDQAPPTEVIAKIVAQVRRMQPHVVVTFAHDGSYGHPDHIAISQFTLAALVCAADAAYPYMTHVSPWRVSKLYFLADHQALAQNFETITGGPLTIEVDGVQRRLRAWEDWAITTRIMTGEHWRAGWAAALCHQTQIPSFAPLLPYMEDSEQGAMLWGEQCFYRVFSLVNGGRRLERDLFEGLREP